MTDEEKTRCTVGAAMSKYPIILATLLYGSSDPELVTRKVLDHLLIERELRADESFIRAVIPKIMASTYTELDAGELIHLDLMSEKAGFLSYGLYTHSRGCSPAELLLGVMVLTRTHEVSVDSNGLAFDLLPVYAWSEGDRAVGLVLWAVTFDLMLAHEWYLLPKSLYAHTSVSLALRLGPLWRMAIAAKVHAEGDMQGLRMYDGLWHWEDGLSWIRAQFMRLQAGERPDGPFSESTFDRVEKEWKEALAYFGELLSSASAGQSTTPGS